MKKRQTFYFELDALVDTRFGLLVKDYSERVNAVDINAYRDRKTSYVWEYFGVTAEVWKKTWSERTTEVLKWSAPTEMLLRINELFITPLTGAATSPIFDNPAMIINTYPYKFEEEEIGILIESIHEVLLDRIPVKVVWLAPEDVTPMWIAANCESMVLYNFSEWFSVQAKNFQQTPLPQITIHFPALINEGREDDPLLVKKGIVTAFSELTFSMSEYFNLRAIDPHLYSLPPDL